MPPKWTPNSVKEFEERFWSKVVKESDTGCWNWVANNIKGYGRIRLHGKMVLAHRMSWKMYKEYVSEDIDVLHKCDNPSCVNPDHLYIGTHTDNMQDKISRGRITSTKGTKRNGILYSGEAWLMWKLLDNKVSHLTIGKIFNCSISFPYVHDKLTQYRGKEGILERRA